MTPPMYERVKDMFATAGLDNGYTAQTLFWSDTKSKTESFMVFSPSGGTMVRDDLASDYYVDVIVIGADSKRTATANHVQKIIDHIQSHPTDDQCINYIESFGMPSPMPTSNGRIVFPLRFRCVYGD